MIKMVVCVLTEGQLSASCWWKCLRATCRNSNVSYGVMPYITQERKMRNGGENTFFKNEIETFLPSVVDKLCESEAPFPPAKALWKYR